MRNIFSIMLLWFCQTALFAQYGGVNGGFNPQNPANPQSGGVRYGLTVRTQSETAGWTNVTYAELGAGESIHLYAYPSTGYEFKEWRRDDRVQTTSQDFVFTMPESDVTLTAVFTFNPESPANPGANDWNSADGTLIIDDFEVGGLADAIRLASNGDYDAIKTLIVSGNINNYDLGSLSAFKNIEVIDLSRCYGADTVPAYYMQDNTVLKEISLPASIKVFEDNAFIGCSALTLLNMYATVPPELMQNIFDFDRTNFQVHVPEDSYALYANAAGWKELTINGLAANVHCLEVDLPDDYSDDRYVNMYVVLKSSSSDQTMTLLITSGVQAYIFKNLRPDTKWTATVQNAAGQELGSITDIEMGESNKIVKFDSLLTPQTITVKVLSPGGQDLTSDVSLTWLSATGDFMGKGSSLDNVLPLEGASVILRIVLPEDLTMEYVTPDDYVYSVQPSDNDFTYTLTAIEKVTLTGRVADQDTKVGIPGASVIVAQTLYGRYTKNFTATTDADGAYTITGAYGDAPTTVSASATDYASATADYEAGVTDLRVIGLKSLKSETNTTVTITFLYKASHEAGKDVDLTPFTDVQNVMYTIVNKTRETTVSGFNVVGNEIVITDKVNEGDELTITAISKNGAFDALVKTCVVSDNKAKANFIVTQLGQLKAEYVNSEATVATAILYDANGKFVTNAEYDANKSVLFTDLPEGLYTLVSMSRSKLFNSIYDLSKFADNGLEEGVDYVTNKYIYVEDGIIVKKNVAFVPYLDESKFDFMSEQTTFSVNKTLAIVNNNLTLTAFIDFKELYAPYVSNVELVVDLDGCDFVEGSAMSGSEVTGAVYDEDNKQVVIPVSNLADRIRFCVKSKEGGDFAPTASVRFYFNDQQMTKPIGQVSFTIEKLGISVPETVSTKMVPASGTATPRAQVWIYDDNELIGMTLALSNGSWSQDCELIDPENPSEHHIYAVIKSGNEETQTETKTVKYAESAPVLNHITMLNTAHPSTSLNLKQYETTFNFTSAQTRIPPYWYWPTYPEFTFLIYFVEPNTKPYDVDKLELIVFTSDRKYRALTPSRYDTNRKAYVVTSRFYTDALPVSVNVREKDAPLPQPHKPYVEYVLDPSGYVYEGVASNRLEGVTATIYYRENESSPATLWDATLYDQENPVLTDEYGMYAWDVPEGQWQIRFEKDGYETTQSAWLPVPPPQLNINIPMTQSTAPVVKSVKADNDGIEIEFDKFMLTESLTDNIFATDGDNLVEGELVWLNAEGQTEDDSNQERYASRVMYKFNELFAKDEITLTINTNVKSYAGLALASAYTSTVPVTLQVKSLSVEEVISVQCEGTKTLTVEAIPAQAAADLALRVEVVSTEMAEIVTDAAVKGQQPLRAASKVSDGVYTIDFDAEGRATLTLQGDLPGVTALQFSIDKTSVKAQTVINVTEKKSTVTEAPKASRNSGQQLYAGSFITLTSDTEDAKIYFTISKDGNAPADPTVGNAEQLYTSAIVIDEDQIVIKAVAKAAGLTASEVKTFTYTIAKSNITLDMPKGWTWVSHNLAHNINVKSQFEDLDDVMEVKSQTKGIVRDPQYGLFGNLSEMSPTEAYKIRTENTVQVPFIDDAFNATKQAIDLASGWNWLGYPNYQEMTLNEALKYLDATDGDQIFGKAGSAEFVDGAWIGDLDVMTPGLGYMLRVDKASSLSYNTDIVSQASVRRHGRLRFNTTPWSVDTHAYPDNMALRAQLYRADVLTDDNEFTVAAFAGTECRGIGKYVNGVIFLTVQGQGADNITFLAANNETDNIVNIEESVTFKALDVVGTFKAPYALHLGAESDGIRQQYSRLGVWPARATSEITVSLGGKPIDRLTITATDGRTMYVSATSATQQTVNVSNLPAGIYIVAAKSGDDYYYKKITKVNQ